MTGTRGRWTPAFLAMAMSMSAAGVGTGCDTYRLPSDLKFPQILAVRLADPQLLPEQRTAIDVLVTNDLGVPSLVKPGAVEFSPDPATGKPFSLPPQASAFIEHEGDDFFAHAPDEATVNAFATALGLAPTAALKVSLRVTVSIGAETRRADKLVVVLRPGSGVVPTPNPTIKDITVDGQPVSADPAAPPVDVLIETVKTETMPSKIIEHTFVVSADATAGPLTYAWFTAYGDVKHYRATTAIVTGKPTMGGDGAALIVVRNERGGVAWRQFALHLH